MEKEIISPTEPRKAWDGVPGDYSRGFLGRETAFYEDA